MNFLIKNNKEYICQKIFINCINKKVLPFDFYIPEDNLCIEYDGEQHFYHTTYFGGQEKLKITQHHDQIKTKFCEDNNIKLLRIPYWDLKNIDEILEKELNISSIKN